ncbi:MAG: discoidin domain-containing protein [Clostridia bacterium]|nr:discoidin domain-containing protein [Clostridia bacterium]
MKRVLGIVLALAMLISLVSVVPSFAAAFEVLNIDWFKSLDGEGAEIDTLQGAAAFTDLDVNPDHFGTLGGLADDIDAGAVWIQFVGWYLPLTDCSDVGYRVDGGDAVYDGFAVSQPQLCDALAGFGWDNYELALRVVAYIPIQAGTHTIEILASFPDQSEKVIYSTTYFGSENISFGKPVVSTLETVPAGGGKLISNNQFWNKNMINDGERPVFDGVNVCNLGWYISTTTPDVDGNLYIDLEGIYSIDGIALEAMGFNDTAFPNEYTIYTSLDGINWTEVLSDFGAEKISSWDFAKTYSVNVKSARYFRLQVTRMNQYPADGNYYGGLGELEVFGTKTGSVSDIGGRAPYDPAVINFVDGTVDNSADGPGVPSAWSGYTSGYLDFSFDFNTDVSFYAIEFPAFWSYPATPITIELSQDGIPVWDTSMVTGGDGALHIDLGETFPKGLYTLTFYIDDDSPVEDLGGVPKYIVVGHAEKGLLYDEDYFRFDRGNCAFTIFTEDKGGVGFIPLDSSAGDFELGDVDGDGEITDWDCIVFERYLAGWSVTISESAMDLDADGEISDWDAIMLARYLAGWDVTFG